MLSDGQIMHVNQVFEAYSNEEDRAINHLENARGAAWHAGGQRFDPARVHHPHFASTGRLSDVLQAADFAALFQARAGQRA
jgi:hypothetical protein